MTMNEYLTELATILPICIPESQVAVPRLHIFFVGVVLSKKACDSFTHFSFYVGEQYPAYRGSQKEGVSAHFPSLIIEIVVFLTEFVFTCWVTLVRLFGNNGGPRPLPPLWLNERGASALHPPRSLPVQQDLLFTAKG